MKVEINPFKLKSIKDGIERSMLDENLFNEVAKDFGTRVGMAVKEGLDVETAFQLTKDFFIRYGNCMSKLGSDVELHMFPNDWLKDRAHE